MASSRPCPTIQSAPRGPSHALGGEPAVTREKSFSTATAVVPPP
jgi:hypothetical protein